MPSSPWSKKAGKSKAGGNEDDGAIGGLGSEGSEPGDVQLMETYDFLLKFIIIGESGTGKTALLHHFLNNDFQPQTQHTIGVSFSSTLLRLPSTLSPSSSVSTISKGTSAQVRTGSQIRTLKLQLWDTAGQERFRSVTRNYYRGAAGAVICYDITRRSTFLSLPSWLADARALASPDLVCILVGTKLDREAEEREVSWMEASQFAKENDLLFLESSSLSGLHTAEPFRLLARSLLIGIESGRLDPEKAGSGISYGERALRRVSSWGSGFKLSGAGARRKGCCY